GRLRVLDGLVLVGHDAERDAVVCTNDGLEARHGPNTINLGIEVDRAQLDRPLQPGALDHVGRSLQSVHAGPQAMPRSLAGVRDFGLAVVDADPVCHRSLLLARPTICAAYAGDGHDLLDPQQALRLALR